jgi:DegV family protein with EDD domain
MTVRIVTDSTADVPMPLRESLNIGVIPVYINFGAESFPDEEASLPRKVFYKRFEAEMPTTAASAVGDATRVLENALGDADEVIAVHVAPSLSSQMNVTQEAATTLAPDRIHVFDSGSLSMGIGWLAILAAEWAAEGLDAQTILRRLAEVKERLKVWAALDTLNHLRRSGRVSWTRASIGTLLNIKPIILLSGGSAEQVKRVRSFKAAYTELITRTREMAPLDRLAIMHAHDPARAQVLYDALADLVPPDTILVTDIAPSIGTHLGIGAVGIAAIRK